MSDKIRQIIQSQWTRRHSPNPLARAEARNLIRVHVQMLRERSRIMREGNHLSRVTETPFSTRPAA